MPTKMPICPLCEGSNTFAIERSEPPYVVYACRGCELGFVHPLPTSEVLARAYGEAYYEPWRQKHVVARQRMWQRRIDRVMALASTGRLLDIGGGDGAFAAVAAAAGYQVEATEFSAAGAAEIERRVPSATVHIGELVELGLPGAHFDVVTAWHSFEHMRDPFAALAEVRRILRPGGLFLMAVPNRHNRLMALLYRLLKGRPYPLFSLHTKEIHLYHFTPFSLRLALGRAGFTVDSIGWDRSMVEPAKRLIDAVAAVPQLLGGPLVTEAMLAVARWEPA
ncbi:MAG TPA: class I SAM-dependent methyltransferase [Mariprofundaceae bacterium]|nr:class I SAM-dependent methyltransferase [Mariprofundaceae bacterium]